MIARVVLDVPALHCEGCVESTAAVLAAFPGVQAVSGDLAARRLTVEYDLTSITPQAMAAELASVGYPVTGSHGR